MTHIDICLVKHLEEYGHNGRALLGFMQEKEAIDFLKGTCVLGDSNDAQLRETWNAARIAVESLSIPSLVPEILDFDPQYGSKLAEISKQALFSETVLQNKWSFKLVQIDKLVCFQKFVNVEYSEDVGKSSDIKTMEGRLEYCFSPKHLERPLNITYDSVGGAYTLVSPNSDLRVISPIQSQDSGRERWSFGFTVGWGTTHIQVVRFQDRYFLRNGYHRVYKLREKGILHTPCVLVETDDFSEVGAGRPGFFSSESVMGEKPPLFGNFFSEKIAPLIKLNPRTKFIRIKAEESNLPITVSVPVSKQPVSAEFGEEELELGDFKIVKEDWNVYRLSDGTMLKARQLILKLPKELSVRSAKPNLGIEFSSILMAIFPPPDRIGNPSTREYTPEQLAASVVEPNMKYETLRTVVNEYLTENGFKILLQVSPTSISRTNKFGPTGDQIYLVNAQASIQVVQPSPESTKAVAEVAPH